jgi:hypothetical protein
MTLTLKTTHAQEARDRLVEQFKGKVNLPAVLDAFSAQTQDDEAVYFDLLINRALATSVGVQLDGLGDIVGEERLGRSDDDYRLAIRAQIRKNVTSGTGDEILSIIALLTSNTHELIEYFPAGLKIVFDDELPEDPIQLAGNLGVAAGVRGSIEYTLVDDDITFTFADGDTSDIDSAKGFLSNEFVAVGNVAVGDAYVIRSTDGSSWSEISNPSPATMFGVAYGDDRFMAVGNGHIMSSPDGQAWTTKWTGSEVFLGVGYYGGIWMACGINGALYSSEDDGDTWVAETHPQPTASMTDVVFEPVNNAWVVVGFQDATDAYIITKSGAAGSSWIERSNPKAFPLGSVTHDGSGLLVAVGGADGADAYVVTSTDLVTWTERANPKNFDLKSVAHDGYGLFAASGSPDGTDAYMISSSDGITWSEVANPKNFGLEGITFGQGSDLWVAAGAPDGTDAYVVHSSDGSLYTEASNPRNTQLSGIATSEIGGAFADAVEI